jgi:hypothetical protein
MFHRNFSAPGGLYTQMPHGFGSRSARSAAVAVMLLVGEFSYVSIILYIYISLSLICDIYRCIYQYNSFSSCVFIVTLVVLSAAACRQITAALLIF